MKKSNLLMLTGGLGNQLFQLACGLTVSSGDLILDSVHGHPRISKSKKPDLLEFELPASAEVSNVSYSKFISKVLGYNLRLGVVPRKFERSKFYSTFTRILSSMIISLHFKSIYRLQVATGVGFDRKIVDQFEGRFLVGYFQSYKWVIKEKTFSHLLQLRLKEPSVKFLRLLEELSTEPTLILHMRLGDYLLEPAFGTPGTRYFESSLKRLRSEVGHLRVWGFSDQRELAKKMLGPEMGPEVRWVDDSGLSASETLELMRHGSGFVMANSTFSWWAAMLRYDQSALVISPQPWFMDMEEPYRMIPPNWIRENAHFEG